MISFKQFIIESSYSTLPGEDSQLWFHASPSVIKSKFYPLTHFGTSDQIRDRVKSMHIGTEHLGKTPKNRIYGVRLKLNKGLEIEDRGVHHTPNEIISQLHSKGVFNDNEADRLKNDIKTIYTQGNPNTVHKYVTEHLSRAIRNKGYDHLWYKNKNEGDTSNPDNKSIIITHDNQVRVVYRNPNLQKFRARA